MDWGDRVALDFFGAPEDDFSEVGFSLLGREKAPSQCLAAVKRELGAHSQQTGLLTR